MYGYLPYTNSSGKGDTVRGFKGPYALFFRDQVGKFLDAKPGTKIADKVSDMNNADHNSGIFPVKYPFYPSDDQNKISSAYAEVRFCRNLLCAGRMQIQGRPQSGCGGIAQYGTQAQLTLRSGKFV